MGVLMMKYRFYGDTLQLIKYELTVTQEHDGEEYTEVFTAVTDKEKDSLLQRYPGVTVTKIDNTGYEWLDGMTFTQEQLRNGELEKAIEMGQEAYEEMINAPSQDEINAMLMLEIAELKAGGLNE